MIITLISLLLLVLGCIGLYLYNDHNKKLKYDSVFGSETFSLISFGITFISLIALFTSIIAILIANVGRENELNKMELRREIIVHRLEQDEENYFLPSEEINEFNDKVLDSKYYRDNLWLNWFHNTLIAELEIIIPEEKAE